MRLFIGTKLWTDSLEKPLKELELIEGIKPVEKENIHITYVFLGEVSDIKPHINILEKYRGWGAFEVSLKGLGFFPSKNYIKVIWVGCYSDKLYELGKSIASEYECDFTPHITLGRVKKRVNLKDFTEKYETMDFGKVKIDNICIYESILSRKGPTYVEKYKVEL